MSISLNDLPEFLSPSDLVKLGLFSSKEVARKARKDGSGPKFIQLGPRKVKYPKANLQEFVQSKKCKV